MSDGGTSDGGIQTSEGSTSACGDVPTEGRCASTARVEACVTTTGTARPTVLRYDCQTGESCAILAGKAQCVLTAACREGATRCASASALETCTRGSWSATACPNGCGTSSLGSFCAPTGTTKVLSAKVAYEARGPNSQLTDWGPLFLAPAPGFTVLSYSGGKILDTAVTDSNGAFSIDVPVNPTASDVVVVALALEDGAGSLAFAVASPGYSTAGRQDIISPKPNPRLWSYAFLTSSIGASSTLTITEAMGSGAARIYDYLRYAYAVARQRFGGRPGLPLIVWLGYGTSWSCGACFAPVEAQVFNLRFGSQMWMPADENQSYWADSVTGHELGHWAMASYGTSPEEGGPHTVGRPTFPGQAWSEGYATWFSSNLRSDSYYVDKQGGAMFWLNLDTRGYSGPTPWMRPAPEYGLIQFMDENEVSAILWRLSLARPWGRPAIDKALSSRQLNAAPFMRGYTRYTWEINLDTGKYENVFNTGLSRPMVADFLDALVCEGYPAAAVDAATEPATAYPYPSRSPLCASSSCRQSCGGCCQAGVCQPGNTAAACGVAGDACEACGSGQTCGSGVCR